MSIMPTELHELLGQAASNELIRNYTASFGEPAIIKVYPDVIFYNYPSHGISLQFKPSKDYKPASGPNVRSTDFKEDLLLLSTVDIYADKYQALPIVVRIPQTVCSENTAANNEAKTQPTTFEITKQTNGEEIVKTLGEPNRKGGGESRSVPVWLEWTALGIMCEFPGIHGAGRWDKDNGAGSAPVGIWSFFEPTPSKKEEHVK